MTSELFSRQRRSRNSFNEELYFVDLAAWAAAYRSNPGSVSAPVKVHGDLNNEGTAYSNFNAFSDDCAGLIFALRTDHDDQPDSDNVITMQYAGLPATGTSTLLSVAEDLRTGGLYPDVTISPNGTQATWSISGDDSRAWTVPVGGGTPLRLADTLGGEISEFVWLDDERILLKVQRTEDVGLYLWDRTDPDNPIQLTADTPNIGSFSLGSDQQSVVYQETFSTFANQVASIAFAAAGTSVKINGDGTSNGAEIHRAWSLPGDEWVAFAAENEVDGQMKLYAVERSKPGQMVEIFPGDGDATGSFSTSSLQMVESADMIVFEAVLQGSRGIFTFSSTAPAQATQLQLDESITLRSLMAVAPDGTNVMFHGTQDGLSKVFVRQLTESGAATVVFDGAPRSRGFDAFSPDSRYAVFQTGNNPIRAYLVDTEELGAGATSLLDENFPDELPASATDPDPRQSIGASSVSFDAGSEYVYFAYDDTYARNLKVVRSSLATGEEETVSAASSDDETITQWALSAESNVVTYRKETYPDGVEAAPVRVVFAVDAAKPRKERQLSPDFVTGDMGVLNYEIHGAYVAMRTSESSKVYNSYYVASLDGTEPAWRVNGDLASDNSFTIGGIATPGGVTTVVYSAQEETDATSQIYVTQRGETTKRTRIDAGDRASPIMSVSEDGLWLYYEIFEAGVSEGLSVRALSLPAGPNLRLSAQPISGGNVQLP